MAPKQNTISIAFLLVIVALVSTSALTQDNRQSPTRQSKPSNTTLTSANCGGLSDIADKVQVCAKPLMDILTGTIPKWPKTDQDAKDLCDSFIGCEKCIRDVGRKCTKGLHKTIISTLANSISRARKRECQTSKYPAVLKTTQCIEKYQDSVRDLMSNVMGRLIVIQEKFTDLDQKMSGVCCMVHSIEAEIKDLLQTRCPTEGQFVIRLYRGVLDDVIQLICLKPKCNDILKGYKIVKSDKYESIIASLLMIVFSLS